MLRFGSPIYSARVLGFLEAPALSQWSLYRISGKITSVLATGSHWKAGACCGWSKLDEYTGLSVKPQSGISPSEHVV